MEYTIKIQSKVSNKFIEFVTCSKDWYNLAMEQKDLGGFSFKNPRYKFCLCLEDRFRIKSKIRENKSINHLSSFSQEITKTFGSFDDDEDMDFYMDTNPMFLFN